MNISSDPLSTSLLAAIEIKVEARCVPLFNNRVANTTEIEELLDEAEEIYCNEDIIMTIGQGGVPKPFFATAEDIIKRENDKMSGNIPFNWSVSLITVEFFIFKERKY